MKVKELQKLLPNDTLMIIEQHNCNYNEDPPVIDHTLIMHKVGSFKRNPAAEEEIYMIHPIDKNGVGILLKSHYI